MKLCYDCVHVDRQAIATGPPPHFFCLASQPPGMACEAMRAAGPCGEEAFYFTPWERRDRSEPDLFHQFGGLELLKPSPEEGPAPDLRPAPEAGPGQLSLLDG